HASVEEENARGVRLFGRRRSACTSTLPAMRLSQLRPTWGGAVWSSCARSASVASAMQATLELLVPGRGAQQHLMVDGVWRVGREAGELVISHGSISGSHGELLRDSAGLSYRDLGSTNGSYWEQSRERLTGRVKLAAGAALRLGQCTLRALDLSLPTSIAPTAALPSFPESAQLAPAEARSAMTAGASAAPPPRGSESARGVGSTGASAGTYSHPGARVRHSYPLAIGDAGLATAF